MRNSPVNCLWQDPNAHLQGEAQRLGLTVLDAPLPGIRVVKGEWPAVRLGQGRSGTSGPTGNFWIDSNGWQVRLAGARAPGQPVWVQTEFAAEPSPEKRVFTFTSYLLALADAAAHGARWVIHLDPDLCRSLGAGDARALETWKKLMDAARFFDRHRAWGEGESIGVLGVLSDFAGDNEFGGGELLNLAARLHQPYRILLKSNVPPFAGFRAIIYPDAEPVKPELRRKLVEFVHSGGLLIGGKLCGIDEGTPSEEWHRNYEIRRLGRGRIAIGELQDLYETVADMQVLLSHRYDQVRFWNCSSFGSYFTAGPGGKGALLQIVNYAGRPGADRASVRISGPFREARIQRLEDAAPQPLEAVQQKGALELHLPPIAVYAAIELA